MSNVQFSEHLSDDKIEEIKKAIMQAALEHLNARDAETALRHYTSDAIVITNGHWFESSKAFEEDVRKFFRSLKEVKLAVWERIRIHVLSSQIGTFSALVRWSSVDNGGEILSLKGTWSAVYGLQNGRWRILLRHESYEESDNQKYKYIYSH
jgi:ketosteroid isomerase-like protein